MNWFKLLRYDLRKGLTRKRYLAVPLLFGISCLVTWLQRPMGLPAAGWMDQLLACFRGMPPLDTPQDFQLPVLWFLVTGGCLFLNLDYLLEDLTQEGQQIMVRSVSRTGWYLSKCVWSLASCGVYLFLGMVTCLIMAWLTGGDVQLTNDPAVTVYTLGSEAELGMGHTLLVGVLLPWLTLAMLSQMQMTLCLYIKPALSFLITAALLVSALMLSREWMPGNGVITVRSSLLPPGQLPSVPMLITALTFLAAGIAAGLIRFRKMDLLRYEGE